MNDKDRTIVTIGSFDGVHRGHQVLLKRMADLAKKHSLKSVVITFFPHPRQTFDVAWETPFLLNVFTEKYELLKKAGVDEVNVWLFDKTVANLSPTDFINITLIKNLNAHYLVVGQDHRFGRKREGNVQNLLEMASQTQLNVEVVNLKMLDQKISSSAIREALKLGDIDMANNMLGYNFLISGQVIEGNRLGQTIGFPTANIKTPCYKLLPREGVYRVKVKIGAGKFRYTGMMYIGRRSIVENSDNSSLVEVHIFNFKKQIYGQEITIALTHRIRDEIVFENKEQLAEQLRFDKENILKIK